MNHRFFWILAASAALVAGPSLAQERPGERPAEAREAVDFTTLHQWLRTAANDLAKAEGAAEAAPEDIGGGGSWRFVGFGQPVLVLASAEAGRMRIISPVIAEGGGPVRPDEAAMRRVLEANFSSALDARYVLHRGELWAAYLHPLAGLDETQLRSGLQQVLNLGLTYGTTYTSSGLQFGGEEPAEAEPRERDGGDGADGSVV